MQAIVTKYLAPTNHRGARIRASAQAKSITMGYDYAADVVQNHEQAARMLTLDLGWEVALISGALPDGTYAHVVCECADLEGRGL